MSFNMERLQIKGIYVDKYDFQGIVLNRKLEILSIRSVDGKLVIEYVTKRNRVRGRKELKDHGPVKA